MKVKATKAGYCGGYRMAGDVFEPEAEQPEAEQPEAEQPASGRRKK